METQIYHYIIDKANAFNCIIHAINDTENHIHLVVSIPPTFPISYFVKNIKGSSSNYLNNFLSRKENKFAWQTGYGVFSLRQTQLERAIAYVDNQKQHHLKGTFNN
ncbi:IS200/IS605 family transposase [Dapis sp. BLCC M229]|uniref:IS200/IS605 family transposase n=1 Tax=Dapis sp. BLCC M229 TaxID=3400188 RepID=UPI003CEFD16A